MGRSKEKEEVIQYSEKDVRRMRDLVYGHPITDREWLSAGKHWMKPEEIAWLASETDKEFLMLPRT